MSVTVLTPARERRAARTRSERIKRLIAAVHLALEGDLDDQLMALNDVMEEKLARRQRCGPPTVYVIRQER
jgi:hypothetical protein